MKRSLLITLLVLGAAPTGAEVVTAPSYGFSATFPASSDWSTPEHTRSAPHAHVLTWSSKNQTKKQMIYVSIVDAPLPDRKPTFRENALEWEKGVRESAKKITLAEFTTLGGREAYKITGTIINFGSEFFFVRWMSLSENATYQVSLVSEAAPDLGIGAFHDFLGSLVIQNKEPNQASEPTAPSGRGSP